MMIAKMVDMKFIELTAGIIQGIFYQPGIQNYVNYARIGMVAGHELTHGFDDEGRLYDKDGSLNDWWTPEIEKKFNAKAKCIIDQYSNYSLKELNNTHVSEVMLHLKIFK